MRWLLIAAAATVVLLAAERLTRRLAPLATLLALSLTFPDRAPPRFRVALRNSSTRQLHDRIDEARRGELGNTTSEAAERVLELVAALSMHDRITRGHSERVRAYSRMLGEELGLGDVELDRLQWAGLLHDVGKLLIPDEILNKPGRSPPRSTRRCAGTRTTAAAWSRLWSRGSASPPAPCGSTMSGGTVAATRPVWPASTSRWRRGSSPSPTRST